MFTSQASRAKAAGKPRIVADLAFPEIIIVWALRHSLATQAPGKAANREPKDNLNRDDRQARIAPEFSRALGLARLEESLAALASLTHSLTWAARLPQATAAISDDRVTAAEEAVLATLSAFQRGEATLAQHLGEWLVRHSEQRRFIGAARQLAEIMAEAGQFIPHDATRPQPIGRQGATAGATDWRDLTASERHLVSGLRLWVNAFKSDDDPLKRLRTLFGRPSAADPALSLHTILRNTTFSARRPIDVRCRNCPGLSPDEARLLDCIAWLQREMPEPASAALAAWLPPAALRLSMDAARGLASGLLLEGQILPRRDWDYAVLDAAAKAPKADEQVHDIAGDLVVDLGESHDTARLQAAATAPTLH